MLLTKIAGSLIAKGEVSLALRLHKVTAFDTRFNLYQDGKKCMYLLDIPIFDKYFELHLDDGSKKLLTNDEAVEILKEEKDFNGNVREKAIEQLKKINRFTKMGNVTLEEPEPEEPEEHEDESEDGTDLDQE